MKSDMITFEDAVASLEEESRALAEELHARSTSAGFVAAISGIGKKADSYKIEYKKPKSSGSLYIARIDGKKLSLRCKLFHLGEYPALLDELSETARAGLLSSKQCVSDSGCKGPVVFSADGKEYSLCRHSMQFKAISVADAQAVWNLLAEEERCREASK